MSQLMDVCFQCARAAVEVLKDHLGRVTARQKGPGDLVTEADFAAQQVVRQIVAQHFPDHGFVGEEGPKNNTGETEEYVWYVDPLDGTTNYVRGLRYFAVSIGVARRGELECGVVLDPMGNECFAAEKGGGATLNGQPLRPSSTQRLSEALVAVSLPVHSRRGQRALEQVLDVLAISQGVRRMGSAALNLCYVAAGRFDACWDAKTSIWDVAAGVLIVQEAGGVVSGPDGGPFQIQQPTPIAAANLALHRELLAVLSGQLQ